MDFWQFCLGESFGKVGRVENGLGEELNAFDFGEQDSLGLFLHCYSTIDKDASKHNKHN